jgi:RNA polymerase sigma factor (sigma-70 family)
MSVDVNKTIEENAGLVNKMACGLYRNNSVYSLEDLIQVGFMNLITALPKYDETRSKLSTFIGHCVKNSMIKFIKKNHDNSKINSPNFEAIPISGSDSKNDSKNVFFDGDVVYGSNLYYNDDHNIEEYIDCDEMSMKVIKLKMNGHTQKDIKNITGLKPSDIKSVLNNAKQQLTGIS